ncbi:MAG: hypothetical protein II191_03475 [Clostridia bacterium]|nr:hypothetical protein [Clostridia bacterium]
MNKRILSAMLAILFVFAISPSSAMHSTRAEVERDWTVPEGYNEHDYNAIASFLEQTNSSGIKNGEIINSDYDVNDPSTWECWVDNGENTVHKYVQWDSFDGEERLFDIHLGNLGLCGEADFSDCTELSVINLQYNDLTKIDLSSCADLKEAFLSNNMRLSDLDVSECPSLEVLNCASARINELDLSDKTNLKQLTIVGSTVPEIDLMSCVSLDTLSADSSQVRSLDLSNCEKMRQLRCSYCFSLEQLILPDNSDNLELISAAFDPNLSEIKLDGCSSLIQIILMYNNISSIDLSDCSNLRSFVCEFNHLEELDVSSCSKLEFLDIYGNNVTEIDLSLCKFLSTLQCGLNKLTSLDLSNNILLPLNGVYAFGNGSVGYYYQEIQEEHETIKQGIVYAQPNEHSDFIGWFNESGTLLSTEAEFDFLALIGIETVLIARFTGGEALPGDVDADGEVSVADALLALRSAMGVLELSPEQTGAADMNGDGTVSIDEALVILRKAMGLID